MIAIVNVSGDRFTPDGPNEYEVRINRDLVCRFTHLRARGLAACLRAAADAVEQKHKDDLVRIMEATDGR